MDRLKLATVWLGGCSGCHMSFLDLDEWLFDLAARVEVVYSPLVDLKTFPDHVDLTLVEGAVANEEHLEQIRCIRRKTRLLIAFGDCAVTGNVTALRNQFGGAREVLQAAYLDGVDHLPQIPSDPGVLPPLIDRVLPVHQVVPVDLYLPGCPPPADRIRAFLEQVLDGVTPEPKPECIRFG
jgi:NAD-reducing hydrogenase small subunit